VVRLELIQNLKNFTASTNSLANNQVRKCLFRNDEPASREKSLIESDKKDEIIKSLTQQLLQSLPSLVVLAVETGIDQTKLDSILSQSLFNPRCYNVSLSNQLSDGILASSGKPEAVLVSTDKLGNVSIKTKPSTPTLSNRVSAPSEANSKKEYEDLVVTAQTSQRPSKAGTPTLNPSMLKKRSYEQFLASSNTTSNLNQSVQKSKPKLSTTTADHTYDYRVTPQSEMKSNNTPYK